MKKTLYSFTFAIIFKAILLAHTANAFTPFSVTFGSDNDGDGGMFLQTAQGTAPSAGTWSITPNSIRYDLPVSDNGNQRSEAGAMVELLDFAASTQQNFIVTLTGSRVQEVGDFSRFGVVAMGDGNLGAVYNSFDGYHAFVSRAGAGASSRGFRLGTGNWNSDEFITGISRPVDFTITMNGTYNTSGHLTIVANLVSTDADENITSYTLDPVTYTSPKTDAWFGLGVRANVTASTPAIYEFYSFSVIPEPRTYGMIFGAVILLVVGLRRFRRS